MMDGTQKRAPITSEDGMKMRRLSEEISERIQEMALIFARAADPELGPEITPKFALRRVADPHLLPGPQSDVDIEIFDLPDGTHCCYDYLNQFSMCLFDRVESMTTHRERATSLQTTDPSTRQ